MSSRPPAPLEVPWCSPRCRLCFTCRLTFGACARVWVCACAGVAGQSKRAGKSTPDHKPPPATPGTAPKSVTKAAPAASVATPAPSGSGKKAKGAAAVKPAAPSSSFGGVAFNALLFGLVVGLQVSGACTPQTLGTQRRTARVCPRALTDVSAGEGRLFEAAQRGAVPPLRIALYFGAPSQVAVSSAAGCVASRACATEWPSGCRRVAVRGGSVGRCPPPCMRLCTCHVL